MLYRAIITTILMAVSSVATAESFDITLSDESAQFKYNTVTGGSQYGKSELGFGYLYNEERKINLTEFGLMVVDAAGTKAPGLKVGIGPKLYVVTTDHSDVAALGLGGMLRYKPGNNLSRFFLRARYYYAPSVVTFGDADFLQEFALELGFEIIPTADIYVGYRNIETDFDVTNKDTIDDSVYFGMKISF